jgi:hypothetical protein
MHLFHFSTCFEQPRAHHHENQFYQYIWYMSLCVGDRLVYRSEDLHTRRSATQSDTYQMLYWYNWFSWWWARVCSKHVENWNKIYRKILPDLHTRRSPTQSDTYHILYWYNWFSWWWARGCSKHVGNWNKHTEKKNCASSWSFTRIACRYVIATFNRFSHNKCRKHERKKSSVPVYAFLFTDFRETFDDVNEFLWTYSLPDFFSFKTIKKILESAGKNVFLSLSNV